MSQRLYGEQDFSANYLLRRSVQKKTLEIETLFWPRFLPTGGPFVLALSPPLNDPDQRQIESERLGKS
jgi:hypothetical protein